MRINSTGNVGIGTTSPQRRLDFGTTAGGMTFGDVDEPRIVNEAFTGHSGAGTTGYGIFRQANLRILVTSICTVKYRLANGNSIRSWSLIY